MHEWYTIILFIHILAGATWVGAGVAFLGHAERMLRKEGQVAADRMHQEFTWSKWIFIPMPLLALTTGITVVVMPPGIGLGDLWVTIAHTLFVLALVLGGGVGGAYETKLDAHREVGTVDRRRTVASFAHFSGSTPQRWLPSWGLCR